jgi:hypothetical protein
MKNLPKINLL